MVGSMQTPIIPIGSGQTQELIAPVQDTLIAKQNYAKGQQFILGGALFTVTKSGGISVGDTINMNTDVEASDNITDQINEIKEETLDLPINYTNLLTYTSTSNLFTCPADGYVFAITQSTSATTNAVVRSRNGYPFLAVRPIANVNQAFGFFVKKGMHLYVENASNFVSCNYFELEKY